MGRATHAWRRPWRRGACWGSWPRDTGASGDRTDTLAAAGELRGATFIPVGRHHATTRGGVDGLAPESGECMARRPRSHGACAAQALPSCRCCRSETQGRSRQGPRLPVGPPWCLSRATTKQVPKMNVRRNGSAEAPAAGKPPTAG